MASSATKVPLTTIWAAPAGCGQLVQPGYATTSTSCAPPQFGAVWPARGYWSPAICPSRYSIGCAVSDFTPTLYPGQTVTSGPPQALTSLASGESAYICVPS